MFKKSIVMVSIYLSSFYAYGEFDFITRITNLTCSNANHSFSIKFDSAISGFGPTELIVDDVNETIGHIMTLGQDFTTYRKDGQFKIRVDHNKVQEDGEFEDTFSIQDVDQEMSCSLKTNWRFFRFR